MSLNVSFPSPPAACLLCMPPAPMPWNPGRTIPNGDKPARKKRLIAERAWPIDFSPSPIVRMDREYKGMRRGVDLAVKTFAPGFLRLNLISALYALPFTIYFELGANYYRIERLTGRETSPTPSSG